MSGEFFLDWAIMAVSLFNTILLIWLGLTVVLNAERRSWGVWLTGGGLLTGGAFFISHSAILGHGDMRYVSAGMDFWWHAGWLPAVALPFAWYVVMLWYAGFWEADAAHLHRRHRMWFLLSALSAAGLGGLLFFANPLPSYGQVAQLELLATPALGGMPVLILFYPLYSLLCIGLALDALGRPGPSQRVMGELARRRARPWLIAASLALLLVSLLVGCVMMGVVVVAGLRAQPGSRPALGPAIARFDLAIALLIAAAVIVLGQAIVSYEVFTGQALPRGGFRRHWRNAASLAAGYGIVVGWTLTIQLRQVYSLLLTALLMTVFYALLSWRLFAEREQSIGRLRPFVASQRLYDRLLSSAEPAGGEMDAAAPFYALCGDVLGVRLAYLLPWGPLSALAGPPLVYPAGPLPALPVLAELVACFDSPQTMCVPLDAARYSGALWGVPLWSERGLIGILMLGGKRDGGLYTQEEIEIARTSGERLIDTLASVEMAHRLMALQRQRLAHSQVLDQRVRRTLHDDVLPRLQAAMLSLGGEGEVLDALAGVHRQISDLLRDVPAATIPELSRLGLIGALRQTVDDELRGAFDAVTWQVEPEAEGAARALPALTAEVLFYAAREAIRNAAHHARGTDVDSPLHVRVGVAARPGLHITIEDDGVGLAGGQRPAGGSGQGLALHGTLMAVVGGTLAVDSQPGAYTRVVLALGGPALDV